MARLLVCSQVEAAADMAGIVVPMLKGTATPAGLGLRKLPLLGVLLAARQASPPSQRWVVPLILPGPTVMTV